MAESEEDLKSLLLKVKEEVKKHLLLGIKAMKPRQRIKKQRHHFAYKGLYSQSYCFSSSHVWM